jgi:hypothetical protein
MFWPTALAPFTILRHWHFVDIPCLVCPCFTLEESLVETPDVVVNASCEFFPDGLVHTTMCLLDTTLRS